MKNVWLAILVCFTSLTVAGQNSWGKMDANQFNVRYCPFDSTANAMVLYDRCIISFKADYGDFNVLYKRYRRIQVLNKQGFEQASVSIPYYTGGDDEAIIEFKAQTLNPGTNGEVKATKVESSAVVDEKVSEKVTARKFAFGNVKEGSVIEYEYTLRSTSIRFLHEHAFQSDIPTLRSSLVFRCPQFLKYVSIFQGTLEIDETASEDYIETYPATFFQAARYQDERRDVNIAQSTYTIKNAPALKEEKYITTMADYEAKMKFVLSLILMPNSTPKDFAESWTKLAEELMKNENFGLYLNGTGEHLKVAQEFAKSITDKPQRIKAIYSHLTQKVKWNERYRITPTDRLAKSYKDGTGSSADVNMLLVDMLREAGIAADPVLISTRGHGKVQKLFPNMSQFNHVIAVAETDSGKVFLDATNSIRPYYLLAVNDLNSQGLQITREGATWVSIPPSKNSTSVLVCSMELDAKENIKAKAGFITNDYEAVSIRNDLLAQTPIDCLKENLVIADGAEILEPVIENQTDNEKKLKINFDINATGKDEESKLIYFNPFPVKFRSDNPFKLAKRFYPVSFGYPFEETIKVSVKIPANYKVTELPKSTNVKLDDESASFLFLIAKTENNIQITSSLKILKAEYGPELYDHLKSIFASVIDTYNTPIVLEKQ